MADASEKRTQLESIRDRIEQEWGVEETAFFEPEMGVDGFFGIAPVAFISQKASVGPASFPTRHDEFYYSMLIEYDFDDAHLTDVSKKRGKAGPIDEGEALRMMPYLREELTVIDPELVVAVGRRAEQWVLPICAWEGYEYGYIPHYSYASRWGNELEFEEHLKAHAQ